MRSDKRGNVLTTLVFTDIVASTQVADELGDRRWRELLARHHRIVRDALREFGGRELDTAGDGVFARFDSPASGIRFACFVADAVRELGIEIRAGVHIGDCEVFDGKLSGVNVHVAARTMAAASAGEVLVTGSVRDLVRGAGFGFADRGAHRLRGIEEEWRLFEVTSVDDGPRPHVLSGQEARLRRREIEPPPLVKRRRVRLTGAAVAIALLVAGASLAVAKEIGGNTSARPVTGCELTSNPPLNDRAFNQAVFDGLTDAATTWGISIRDEVTQTSQFAEWKGHLNDLIRQRCGLIVTVSDVAAGSTAAAARSAPGQRFLATDAGDVHGPPNFLAVVFQPSQAAFLAGYLAAGLTKTGKVGTFGGIPTQTVIPFVNGFAAGVLYYNRRHGAKVRLLGWNPATQSGTFVSQDPTDFGAFADPTAASRLTADLVHEGADIVMPVDGPRGEVGACGTVQRTRGVLLIGVDSDQHFSTPQCESRWLTSVLKIFRRMVYVAMGDVVHGRFKGGVLKGTLANGGVGLAPFYGLGSRIRPALRAELDQIKKDIIKGSLSVDPAAYS
jgi:basic membrane protein A and related proteins